MLGHERCSHFWSVPSVIRAHWVSDSGHQTGVPSNDYKIATSDLKDGVVAVNFSSAKNFEADIRDKVRLAPSLSDSSDGEWPLSNRPQSTFRA